MLNTIKSAVSRFGVWQKTRFFNTALIALLTSGNLYAQVGKLAIVIDDVGYHQKEDAAVLAMPKEISLAIIPSAPYARQRNQQAKIGGHDVLIHMPMQPLNNMRIEEGGLLLGMSAQQVAQRVATAKNIVSNAIGMNNHMGSAATSDPVLMNYLMSELAKYHLFFLDSRTVGHSVAGKIAREQGVQSLDRHIFLDDSDVPADIQRQYQRAIQYARKHGTAIVIGHPRKNTVAVLQAGLRNLPEDIQLVSMGSLWRNEKVVPAKPFILIFGEQPAPTSIAPFTSVPLLRGVPH
ncbi:divergent polysaccharide deacetylase family protein [Pasteurellaceae bacterium LIM206]|nr:divergent polysaccharide deacetylase family protein [Pasteurellaceae bacterium LIM206]